MKHTKRTLLFLSTFLSITTALAAGQSTSSAIFQMRLAVPATADSPTPGNSDRMILQHVDSSGRTYRELLDVERKVLLDQKDVKTAKVVTNGDSGQPRIAVTFSDQGRKHFAEVTRNNINKRLAILLGGQIYSAPVIKTEIPAGKAEISGSFSQQDAEAFCQQINNALAK